MMSGMMIPGSLIVLAAVLVGGCVVFTATGMGCPWPEALVAAVLSSGLIIAWRAASNLYGLNEEVIPMVSAGDMGCLLTGALGPALVAFARRALPRRWTLALIGGVLGFLVNVVML